MTGALTGPRSTGRARPVAVLLTGSWEPVSESGWITRQMMGAIASEAEVHVITPGSPSGGSDDSVFKVHRLDGPWSDGAGLVAELAPELVIVAGHDNVGALHALAAIDGNAGGRAGMGERSVRTASVTLFALAEQSRAVVPDNLLVGRAERVLVVGDAERTAFGATSRGRPVYRIGAPLTANPNARSEPNTWVGDDDYVLVVTDVREGEDHEQAELANLVRLCLPGTTVGISYTDAFCVWARGRARRGWPIERSSDMARLMAWARVMVDLRPGDLFARRCVESLLYGTPIVVPHDSRAREHAERGRGGLWFEDPAELVWCIEALLDPTVSASLGSQGRAYAEKEYGSTDGFITRVLVACGLGEDTGVAGVRS